MVVTQCYYKNRSEVSIVQTIAQTAEKIKTETDQDDGRPWYAIYNFLDRFNHLDSKKQYRSVIENEPESTGMKIFDVYLAALAEHIAFYYDIGTPDWTQKDCYFLTESHYVPSNEEHKRIAFLESPAAFRRRGLYIMGNDLEVV